MSLVDWEINYDEIFSRIDPIYRMKIKKRNKILESLEKESKQNNDKKKSNFKEVTEYE